VPTSTNHEVAVPSKTVLAHKAEDIDWDDQDETSILFGLDVLRSSGISSNPDLSVVALKVDLETIRAKSPASVETPDKYRTLVRDALNHDLRVWRKRRKKTYRGWFLPHVIEPTLLGLIVSAYFLMPQLGLSPDLKARLETVLSLAGAAIGAALVAHRLIQDPDGKKRGYIGRLDRMIAMTDGYKVQLDMEDALSYEKVEFVRRSVKVAHSVLRPDEVDL
jgi:hypothetical protein